MHDRVRITGYSARKGGGTIRTTPPLEGLTLLHLDDDDAVRTLVRALLERHGVRVKSAADASTALSILEESPPDIILCDVLMPGVDGHAFHEAVRGKPAWRGLPFIYVTALGGHGDYRRGMNKGADGYLSKPFTEAKLLSEIGFVLERHHAVLEQPTSITLLGGQSVRKGAALLSAPDRGAEGLVFYLLSHSSGAAAPPVDRETVLDEVWGGLSKSGFRSVLSRARRWSEPWAQWFVDGGVLRLTPKAGVRCDLYELETALRTHVSRDDKGENGTLSSSRLAALYPGPLLPGYHDAWAEERRQALLARVKETFLDLAGENVTSAAYREGLRRALEVDPSDFELWELYIAALEAADLQEEAMRAREKRDREGDG